MSTPLAVFGPGILIATRTDVTPSIPINVGFVQEFEVEMAGTNKQLYGQYQVPLVVARGTIKMTGKFKAATVSGLAMNLTFWGGSFSTTSNILAWNVGSTFTTNSTGGTGSLQVGSSTTFDADLGVTYSTTGLPLQRVSTGNEVAGKYSIGSTAPGLYNFADQGANVKVTYTSSTGAGQSLLQSQNLIGNTPTLQLDYYSNLNQPSSKPFVVRFFAAVASKYGWAFKLEDFNMPSFEVDLYANAAGQIFNLVTPEIS